MCISCFLRVWGEPKKIQDRAERPGFLCSQYYTNPCLKAIQQAIQIMHPNPQASPLHMSSMVRVNIQKSVTMAFETRVPTLKASKPCQVSDDVELHHILTPWNEHQYMEAMECLSPFLHAAYRAGAEIILSCYTREGKDSSCCLPQNDGHEQTSQRVKKSEVKVSIVDWLESGIFGILFVHIYLGFVRAGGFVVNQARLAGPACFGHRGSEAPGVFLGSGFMW